MKWVTGDEMVRQHYQLNGHQLEQIQGVRGGQGTLVGHSPQDLKELDTIEQLSTAQEVVTKTISKEKKCKKAKWLPEEPL